MSEQTKFLPPRNLLLGGNKYSYKDQLIDDFYSYRCTHQLKCKIVIKIKKDELIKYNKNQSEEITYEITSTDKQYICNENKKEILKEKVTTKNNTFKKELAKALILASINKPLSFHYSNLRNNKITLSKNQTKRLLQKLEKKHIHQMIYF